MELDKRIKEGKRPLTCLDIEQAREFVGKECIFSDKYENFKNLDKYLFVDNSDYSAILSIDDYTRNGDYVFRNAKNGAHYGLILPLEWVKEPEKKYRPFKDHAEYKEYLNDGIIESWIQIREKLTGEVSELMYVGGSEAIICLGAYSFDLNNLFYDFELFNESTCEWQPFGVLEND